MSEMLLTCPYEIVEYDNTCIEAPNIYHKVCIILHADWSYYAFN